MANKIQLRRDTSSNWTSSNPTLSQGELGHETNTGKLKVGDGSTAWNSLGYVDTTYSVGDGGLTQNNFTDADHSKLDGIETSANNYSHPNHSGEVTSTGDGATVIADNVVDEANLKVSNAPTDGYFLQAQSGNTGGLTWAAASGGGGGSPDLFDENYDGTSGKPTATGTNSVSIGRSNSSGTDSLAAAIATNSSSYGALGANSIAIGKNAKADYGLAIATTGASGTAPYISASGGMGIGNNVRVSATYGLGFGNILTVDKSNSMAIGGRLRTRAKGQFVYGNIIDSSLANGDVQGSNYVLYTAVTDTTPTTLKTTWATSSASTDNQIIAATDTAVTFDGIVTALQNGAQSWSSWKIQGILVNDNGSMYLSGSSVTTITNNSGYTLALSADSTNKALSITFTGYSNYNIRVVANVRTAEVTYA